MQWVIHISIDIYVVSSSMAVVPADSWEDSRPRSESQLSRSFPTGGELPSISVCVCCKRHGLLELSAAKRVSTVVRVAAPPPLPPKNIPSRSHYGCPSDFAGKLSRVTSVSQSHQGGN